MKKLIIFFLILPIMLFLSLDFESLNLQQAIFAFGVVIADGLLIWILSKKSNLFKGLNNNA